MISIETIETYEKYKGDFSLFSKSDDPNRANLTGDTFAAIRGLLEKIRLVKQCRASQEFKEEFHRELDAITDGKETIARLFAMVRG